MNKISPELFFPITNRDIAREVFRKTVSEVQLETSSQCNRKCLYCPVSTVNRFDTNSLLDQSIFNKILAQLSEIDFKGRIGLSLYNEPLANQSIITSIAHTRRSLPKALIYFYSNGDYLNRDMLDKLSSAGLDEINISLHLSQNKEYKDADIESALCKLEKRTGLTFTIVRKLENTILSATSRHVPLNINLIGLNYRTYGQDRGGLISIVENAKPRQAPCDRPFSNFVIQYDGKILPCCQIFPDRKEHHAYIIGDFNDFSNIFEAYTSEVMTQWRRSLISFGPKTGPCAMCSDGEREGTLQEFELRNQISRSLKGIGESPSTPIYKSPNTIPTSASK